MRIISPRKKITSRKLQIYIEKKGSEKKQTVKRIYKKLLSQKKNQFRNSSNSFCDNGFVDTEF